MEKLCCPDAMCSYSKWSEDTIECDACGHKCSNCKIRKRIIVNKQITELKRELGLWW